MAATTAPGYERNRRILLDRVRTRWINGVLEQSLEVMAWIELGLERQPSALHHPAELILHRPPGQTRSLPPDTSIGAVFDEMGEALLILGAPGSGKTTLLLELTRYLLNRAETDIEYPIPVIFNLSPWAQQRLPITDWLVQELLERYQVPLQIGQTWVLGEQVLPLLDGLDEVAPVYRDDCVKAINAFREQHGFLPIVVCSRSGEYAALPQRLRLLGAVEVAPLKRSQIQDYLLQGGEPLAGVRAVVSNDPALLQLLQSPLLLSLVVLAYRGMPAEAMWAAGTPGQRRHQLFVAYVDAMFERRRQDPRHPREKTVSRLGWLARSMYEQGQTEFFLEWMQPDWLPTPLQQRCVTVGTPIAIGCLSGLGFGTLTGLIDGLFNGLFSGLIFGLIFGLATGLVTTLITALILWRFGRLRTIEPAEEVRWSWSAARRELINRLLTGLFGGLLFGLLGGLVLGLFLGISLGTNRGLLAGLFFGLPGGLAFGLAAGLASGLLGGLSVTQLTTARTAPNQGIRSSARHAFIAGLIVGPPVGLVVGLLFGLVVGWFAGPILGLYHGLFVGLVVGLLGAQVAGLLAGGLACVQHLILRVLLVCNGSAPWRYVRFLGYATDRNFLRQVGGGYIFVHRLLLEHFAGRQEHFATKYDSIQRELREARRD